MTLTKKIALAACLLSAVGAVSAQTCASVGGQQVPNLRSFLAGKQVCVGSAPNWTNQEFHSSTGAAGQPRALIDFKRGPAAPGNVDPTKQVGTWVADNGQQATVTYTYPAGGTPYTFILCAIPTVNDPTSYSFVGPSTVPVAKFITTGAAVSCGS